MHDSDADLSHLSTEELMERWQLARTAGRDLLIAHYGEELRRRQAADDDQRRSDEGDDQRDYAEERDVAEQAEREAAGELAAEREEAAALGAAALVTRARGEEFLYDVMETLDRAEELHRMIERRSAGDLGIDAGAHWAARAFLKDAYNGLARARQEIAEALNRSEAPVGP